MKYSTTDKALIAKALAKQFNDDVVKPLEQEAKAALLEAYEANGTDRMRGTGIGAECGCVYIKQGEATEERVEHRFVFLDKQAALEWLDGVDVRGFVREYVDMFCEWHWRTTGEIASGCDVETVRIEAHQDAPVAVIKPNYKTIYEKFAPQFQAAQTLMLGGEDGNASGD